MIKPGMYTTLQDNGRTGFKQYGVSPSGAMDSFSSFAANLLVGNAEHFATIEMTIVGPTLSFQEDTMIAICGGDLSPTIHNKKVPLWRPIIVKKDSVLTFGACVNGCRAYIGIAGGLSVPKVLGSYATDTKARFGGMKGRPLRSGDRLTTSVKPSFIADILHKYKSSTDTFIPLRWGIFHSVLPFQNNKNKIRIIKGKQFTSFTQKAQNSFFKQQFTISTHSNRMGYRLNSDAPLQVNKKLELASEAVTFGSIQVPPDGNPIILMAEHQTTGGYPRIGEVATIDLPILAQCKPGDSISFSPITMEEAQKYLIETIQSYRLLKKIIITKLKGASAI